MTGANNANKARLARRGLRVAAFTLLVFPAWTPADPPPTNSPLNRKQVLALMQKTASWQLDHLPDTAPTTAGGAEPLTPTHWVRAAFQVGLVAAYETTGNARYLDTLLTWGRQSNWQPGPRPAHADDHCIAQVYLALHRLRPQQVPLQPLINRFDGILANPQPGPVAGWSKSKNWSWCDALFMAPPAWAELSRQTSDPRYLDFMNDRWWETYGLLYDSTEHLYYRDDRFVWTNGQPPTDPTMTTRAGGKILWSRGNGWVLAGLVRVLEAMPARYPPRPRYETLFREMASRLLQAQRSDGLWPTNLADSEEFSGPESSGSAFFCYGLAWGLRHGLLDPKTYRPAVERAWQGLSRCVDADGKLGYAQRVGHRPVAVAPDHTMEYATGGLLLAGREVLELIP